MYKRDFNKPHDSFLEVCKLQEINPYGKFRLIYSRIRLFSSLVQVIDENGKLVTSHVDKDIGGWWFSDRWVAA